MQQDLTFNMNQESVAVIKRINQLTTHYWIKTKLSNGLLILAEIACYLLAIGLVIFAILLPDGGIRVQDEMFNNVETEIIIKIKDVVYFFMILKVAIGVLGLLMFVPALLFRKLRKKNNLLEELNSISGDYLKKHELN